jgi:hypothetical protein
MKTGDYLTLRRAEERLRHAARGRGMTGDPLADVPAVADTAAGQLAAVGLWLGLPDDLRRHPATWHMAKATAYGRAAA